MRYFKRVERTVNDSMFEWFGNNRTICDVLDDMRILDKSKNYSALMGLIAEAQIMGNRMESALSDQKDLFKLSKDSAKARKAHKQLKKEYNDLLSSVEKLRKKSK